MNHCLTCAHWLPKRTDPAMARLGFSQCEKKKPGHMTSSRAPACDKYNPLPKEAAQKREEWDAKN